MLNGSRSFRGVRRAEAAIVSTGTAGLMTAALLAEAGMQVVLLLSGPAPDDDDPSYIAACFPEAAVFQRIAAHHGSGAARAYAAALRKTLHALPAMLPIPLQESETCLYARLPEDVPLLSQQMRLFRSLSLQTELCPDACGCPFPVMHTARQSGLFLLWESQLRQHLLDRISAAGGQICQDVRPTGLGERRIYTEHGRIDAPLIILADDKPPGLARLPLLWLLESRTLLRCRVSSPFPLHACQQDVHSGGLCLTPEPGGADASWDGGASGAPEMRERTAQFRRVLTRRMPDWKPDELHCHPTVHPRDGLPLIGPLPDYPGRVLCATGFGRHSLLPALHGAQVLARHVLGHPQPVDQLYHPERPTSPHLSREARSASRRQRRQRLLHPSRPICSHCRSPLRYDPEARWWACPLCGSCFGILGENLSGPALSGVHVSPLQRPVF